MGTRTIDRVKNDLWKKEWKQPWSENQQVEYMR